MKCGSASQRKIPGNSLDTPPTASMPTATLRQHKIPTMHLDNLFFNVNFIYVRINREQRRNVRKKIDEMHKLERVVNQTFANIPVFLALLFFTPVFM